MENFVIQILDILTTSPGNLVYHLVLAFAVITGLQFVLFKTDDPTKQILLKRMRLGFAILLLLQMLLFVSTALFWQGLAIPLNLLPPLDRTVIAISLVWIFWLWAFQTPSRAADVIATLATAAALIAFVFTLTGWSMQSSTVAFNSTLFDVAWMVASMIIVIIGSVFLLIKRPGEWEIAISVAIIYLAGIIAHLTLAPLEVNFAGFVRLAQLCTYPLLPSIVRRVYSTTGVETRAGRDEVKEGNGSLEIVRRRNTADTRTVQAFLDLANESSAQAIGPALARSVAHTMISDLCLIVSAPDPFGQMIIQCGYDLIREEPITGAVLDQKRLPNLSTALTRGKSIRLSPNNGSTPPDLEAISTALGLHDPCPLMTIPLTINNQAWGSLILLSPYTNRVWTTEDQNLLNANGDALSKVLKRALVSSQPEQNEANLRQQVDDISAQFNRLQQDYQLLLQSTQQQYDTPLPSDKKDLFFTGSGDAAQSIQQLEEEKRQLLETIAALQTSEQPDDMHMEKELRLTLEQVAHLQNSLADANMKILNMQHQIEASGQLNNEERDIVTSMVQELRQPLSSILGYTELLLGESVGILGALQRKFLERVKNSSERIRSLLDDLLLYTTMQSQQLEIVPEPISLNTIIDQAITETSPKLREKNITLRVDMPEELPEMYADHEALQQIIMYLLQNAGTVTPMDGDINFIIKVAENQSQPYLLLQITDSGGGIPAEEITRVFSRRYRAENPTIQGVGDNGVGLAIAKTLVEAHNGRIWVESIPDLTSTFSVLMPIQPRK